MYAASRRFIVLASGLAVLGACSGETPEASATATTSDAVPVECSQAPEVGACNGAHVKWAYDEASRRCYPWTWSGCEGVVPFDSPAACQSACEPCEEFFRRWPDAAHEVVPIRIHNTTTEGIWLRSLSHYAASPVQIWNGIDLVTETGSCDLACADYYTEECWTYCEHETWEPSPIYVAPGGSMTTEWRGQHFVTVSVPDRCLPAACGEPLSLSCGRWENAPAGLYEARVTVADAIECFGRGCSCTPNSEGWCALQNQSATFVSPRSVGVSFDLPGPAVDLVIEP